MKGILAAGSISLIVSLFGTPFAIRLLRKRGYGQLIRDDGPTTHHTKRGTPTMGGTVILLAAILGYVAGNMLSASGPTASGLLVLGLATGLGLVGFLDDFIKVRMQRNLGLRARTKLLGQTLVAVVFGILVLQFPDDSGIHPASTHISFVRDTTVALGAVGFVVWALVMVSSTSNGVNLTDGLDGLATGASTMIFAAFVIMTFWQGRNDCLTKAAAGCYPVRDPFDLAILAASFAGACAGFLWWNAAPARIFMGDVGSVPLGFLLNAASAFGLVPAGAGIHAWMVGAAGTMTLAVMSRATLGHTGQQLTASSATQAIYAAVLVAALARICAVLEPAHSEPLLHVAAFAWAAAFFGFAFSFGPLLSGRQARTKRKAVA